MGTSETQGSGKAPEVSRAAPPQAAVTIRVTGRKRRRKFRVAVGYDATFKVTVVLAYCGEKEYRGLRRLLFKGPDRSPDVAQGLTTVGPLADEAGGGSVVMSWVNADLVGESLHEMAPTMAHELVHLADFVLEGAGVKDENGEARAYVVGREASRFVRKFFPGPEGQDGSSAPASRVKLIESMIESFRRKGSRNG